MKTKKQSAPAKQNKPEKGSLGAKPKKSSSGQPKKFK
jgi:hypothetical protein